MRDYPLGELARVYDTNVLAPLALVQLLAAALTTAGGTVVNVSSDAAVEAYPGWVATARPRPPSTSSPPCSGPRKRLCAATPLTQGTCAPTCTSAPSPARTFRTGRSRGRRGRAAAVVSERPPSGRYRAADLAAPAVAS